MDSLDKVLGELLAKGLTSEEIVVELQVRESKLTKETAIALLAQFYKNWGSIDNAIDQPDMHKQWHVYMRHQILQKILESSKREDLRTALAILDSLASIQGVDSKLPGESDIPISITLVPVQLESVESAASTET